MRNGYTLGPLLKLKDGALAAMNLVPTTKKEVSFLKQLNNQQRTDSSMTAFGDPTSTHAIEMKSQSPSLIQTELPISLLFNILFRHECTTRDQRFEEDFKYQKKKKMGDKIK